MRKLYLFVEGGNPNLKQVRREYLFVELLESIDPSEAELLLQVKDKKIKCRGLTYNLVKETVQQFLGAKKSPFSKVATVRLFGNETEMTAFVTDEHPDGRIFISLSRV